MEVPINVKVMGQDRTIQIDSDLSWGKMKMLLNSVVQPDGRGGQRIDMNMFLDKILDLAVVGGFDELKDKTKLLQIPTSEMTLILGEILKIIPLQQYFKNLGMDNSSLSIL